MNYFWLGLGLSVLFHISQYTTLSWFSDRYLNLKQSPTFIEIDLTSPEATNSSAEERPIIKAPDAPSDPSRVNEPAQLFAEKTQRVQQQSQARLKGIQRNSKGVGRDTSVSEQNTAANSQRPRFEFEDAVQGDISLSQQKSKSPSQVTSNQWVFKNQSGAPSQFEYQLSDSIQFGEITALDTDTHIYASFYNRIVDLFYVRWISQLNSIWARLSSDTKSSLSNRIWRTDVEIVMNKDGLYQTGKVLRSSGFNPFDQAAISAFKSAQVFPNPPRGKIDPDGLVRFRLRVGVSVN